MLLYKMLHNYTYMRYFIQFFLVYMQVFCIFAARNV